MLNPCSKDSDSADGSWWLVLPKIFNYYYNYNYNSGMCTTKMDGSLA